MGAKAEIRRVIQELAQQGISVIVISDLEELWPSATECNGDGKRS